jgi:2-dehydropantoate 2-reductase
MLPRPDLVLLCVKEYDLEGAAKDIEKVSGKDTIVIPLANGVDIARRIRAIWRKGVLLPACTYVGTHIESPGVVVQRGAPGRIYFGKEEGQPYFNPSEIVKIMSDALIDCQWFENPGIAIWSKYLFIASFGLVTAYSGKTIGEVFSDPELRLLVGKILDEITAIADKKGIRLPDGIIEETIDNARLFPEAKTSYQRDLESGGKNEGDIFGEAIMLMGKELNVPTPVTEGIAEKIKIKYLTVNK